MSRTIAAIFAHPDDEVLACGATLAKHADAGDDIRILILATGLAARGPADEAAIERLRDQARAASKILGADSIDFGDFPDNQMDTVPLLSVIERISAFLVEAAPAVIYTHHGGDLNVDHRIVQQAVVTACRPFPGSLAHEIRACEVNSSTEWGVPPLDPFQPTIFEPVVATLERKIEALACYEGELRDWPHPRSLAGVRALAGWRGIQCGHEAAEAFCLIRQVVG
jgi:LmbE family N-acetylglucosaminyl deacetylase